MKISLKNIGKKYKSDWIFRELNHQFKSGHQHAILGNNGSGKTTLLMLLSGSLSPTEGEIEYGNGNSVVSRERIFKDVSLSAPYMSLINEFTVYEMALFHKKAKGLLNNITVDDLIDITSLSLKRDTLISKLSSGMLQRLKLGLTLLAKSGIVLLDEPTVNLDKKGIVWYRNMIDSYSQGRTVIVCSNHKEEEYGFCSTELIMENNK